jgi:hypothetical protein
MKSLLKYLCDLFRLIANESIKKNVEVANHWHQE